MKKNLLLVLCCFPLLATACPTVIGVPCSNNLDASSFGFTLTIPPDFICTTVQSNPSLLVSVRYRQNSTRYIAAVTVAPAGGSSGCDIDCNTNGTPDATEIAMNPSLDSNQNGKLDSPAECDAADAPSCAEQGSITTGENITFRVFRITVNPAIVYLAITTLPSGNNLGISVSNVSPNDDPALQTILSTILESVQLTP